MSKPRKPPKREEVKAWLADGKWGGPGIGPLIDNACNVAAAYLRALDVVEAVEAIERITDELEALDVLEQGDRIVKRHRQLSDAIRRFREGR